MRQQNLLIVIILFVLLGGYAFFLQSKLTLEESGTRGFVRSRGFRGVGSEDAAAELDRARLLALASEEELALMKKTQQLAEEVAGLAKELKRERQALSKAQQVPTTQSTADTLPAITDPLPAAKSAGVSSVGTDAASAVKDVSRIPVLQPPPVPAAPAIVQKAPAIVEKAPELDSAAGAQLAQLSDTKRQAREGQAAADNTTDDAGKQAAIKEAFAHSWKGYSDYAWGMDELTPLTKAGKNSFGGLGATMVDSLDTLWLMGLKEEFQRARDWVVHELSFNRFYDASVFETIIRILGGMLTAHELSGDAGFLTRSEELVKILMHAFDTDTGIPYGQINLQLQQGKNPAWTRKASILSEFGTEQLELIQTSLRTGNPEYARRTEAVIAFLHQKYPDRGLLPLYIHPQTGDATTQMVSLGAMGDSYYEYLLKVWIYKGRRSEDDMYRGMWERSMDEMLETLLFKNEESGYTYVAEFARVGVVKHKMDHLSCFIPAMLALGAHAGAVTAEKAKRYMQVAEELTHTCWQMYHQMPTGLAAEYVEFQEGQGMVTKEKARHNLLRPEAMEAMFVLWRTTKNPVYKDWAWQMFQAFQEHCRAEAGYAGLKDVTVMPPEKDNTMQSFWLAETLKYLWLIFASPDVISLDEWVLNTEAHPLPIIKDLPAFLVDLQVSSQ
ncbi:hypothetical protein CVIRNUC_003926 [Coccomyxa viridis]|uniref:alpha-1,2-Mannosidase n=1 Tax=Coccomyxa viridis TaxID=1274662 RepID=A0AAV1I017_9CHLO|nr:hypothetical protein CVIRNUC_003926 [Coccomyxa viridis]